MEIFSREVLVYSITLCDVMKIFKYSLDTLVSIQTVALAEQELEHYP